MQPAVVADVVVPCPSCHAQLHAPGKWVGLQVACKNCRASFLIENPAARARAARSAPRPEPSLPQQAWAATRRSVAPGGMARWVATEAASTVFMALVLSFVIPFVLLWKLLCYLAQPRTASAVRPPPAWLNYAPPPPLPPRLPGRQYSRKPAGDPVLTGAAVLVFLVMVLVCAIFLGSSTSSSNQPRRTDDYARPQAAETEPADLADERAYGSPQGSGAHGEKTVHVNGYSRKNGTYVSPHSRSAPGSGSGRGGGGRR